MCVLYRHSDINGERFYHIAGPIAVGIVGYTMGASTMNTAARYFSLYVITYPLSSGNWLFNPLLFD
jgi:hypothetical protein